MSFICNEVSHQGFVRRRMIALKSQQGSWIANVKKCEEKKTKAVWSCGSWLYCASYIMGGSVGNTRPFWMCLLSVPVCSLAGSQAISMTTEKPSAGEMKSAMEGDARRANQVRALRNRWQLYIMFPPPPPSLRWRRGGVGGGGGWQGSFWRCCLICMEEAPSLG